MKLIPESIAVQFLRDYKMLLVSYSESKSMTLKHYVAARDRLGVDLSNAVNKVLNPKLKASLASAEYGDFIYAKNTRLGYAFKSLNKDVWHFASALTTPLEKLIPTWCIVETGILFYDGHVICDGLIGGPKAYLGPNYRKEYAAELKRLTHARLF